MTIFILSMFKVPDIQYKIRLKAQKAKILALKKKIDLLKPSFWVSKNRLSLLLFPSKCARRSKRKLKENVFTISTKDTIAKMNNCKWETILSVSKYTWQEGKPRTALSSAEKEEILAFRKALGRYRTKSGERSIAVCTSR